MTNNCNREMIYYIPARDLLINRLYFSLSNQSKNTCLTIDCRKSGLSKYRTSPEKISEQFCNYEQNRNDRLYNTFLAKRTEENNDCLVFQIDSMINTTKKGETKFFKPFQELKTFVKNDGRNNDGKRISEQPKYFDKQNGGRRPKNGRISIFLS